MPESVWDAEVKSILDQAYQPGVKLVYVGNRNVEVLTPFPSPIDWRDHWIYFMMVDRFNNSAAPPRHEPWDQPYNDFQGGTFAGIRQQLDYLQELGVGALWLSPLLKNCQFSPSYHGYGFQNFLAIEPRFSSDLERARDDAQFVENELRDLVDAAHARNIYVIFDIVLHHVGDVFSYPGFGSIAPWNAQPYPILWRDEHGQPNPAWSEAPSNPPLDAVVWPRELQGDRFFKRQGNAFVENQIIPAGDFESLKALVTDYQTPEGMIVFQTLVRTFNYLIAKYDVDGFRIDTLMYLDPLFARNFANSIREFAQSIGKKNFFTFGEVWGTEEQIAHFIGRNALEEGEPIGVDAALDYPLFYKLPAVAKGQLAPSELHNLYAYRRQVETGILSTHGDASGFFVTSWTTTTRTGASSTRTQVNQTPTMNKSRSAWAASLACRASLVYTTGPNRACREAVHHQSGCAKPCGARPTPSQQTASTSRPSNACLLCAMPIRPCAMDAATTGRFRAMGCILAFPQSLPAS